TIGEFVASSSALTSSRGGDRCRRCNRLRTRTSSLEGCRAAAAHRRSAPFLARAIHCKPVATGFRLADWTGSIRVVGSAQGRAAVECQALPPPDPSRTYETSELGARRSFGHVLNDQHRWVWVARLGPPELAAARQPDRRHEPEPLIADGPRDVDAFGLQLSDGRMDVVADEVELVPAVLVRGGGCHLGRRQSEDQPPLAAVDKRQLEHVSEERAILLRVRREDHCMDSRDHVRTSRLWFGSPDLR